MSQEHVTESIPAYVLGCLDQAEIAPVQRHLLDCPDCQAEARKYQAVVDQMPLAVRDCAPPRDLREKILAKVESTGVPQGRLSKNISWLSRLFGSPKPAFVAVSVLLVVALVLTNVFQFQQIQGLRQEQAQTKAQAALAFQYVKMAGTQSTPKAAGLLIISSDQRSATLIVDGLPQLPERQEYQLWLIQDGKRTSGGVFNVVNTGFGALMFNAPKPLQEFQAFGITIEPKGGSPGPTGDKVMGGNF